MSDAVTTYHQQLREAGVAEEAAAAQLIHDLQQHPCRQCPSFTLLEPAAAGHPDLQPAGPGVVLARPYCTVMPTMRHTADGQPFMVWRETWTRCPLHGIASVQALIQAVLRRIDALEARQQVPAADTALATADSPLHQLKTAFTVLGLHWSADSDERDDAVARLWDRLTTPVAEFDDGAHVFEGRRAAADADDTRYLWWVTRWSQNHFELHDDAWVQARMATAPTPPAPSSAP